MKPALEPELRHLIAVLGSVLGSGPGPLPSWPDRASQAYFLKLVRRHRVSGWLARATPSALGDALPVTLLDQIKADAGRNNRETLNRLRCLADVASRMQAAGIPFLNFKGPLLSQSLHGDPGVRPAGDLDLLVSPEEHPRADQLLRAQGFRRTNPDFELTPRQWREYRIIRHETEYRHPDGTRIELAWRLEGFNDAEQARWLTRPQTTNTLGVRIPRLPRDAESLYLFQHGAGHGWFRLFWLCDIARLMTSGNLAWEAVASLGAQHGAGLPLWQGAALASYLFRTPLPSALHPPEAQLGRVHWLVRDAVRQLAGPVKHANPASHLLRDAFYLARLRPDRRRRLAVARSRLSSPDNWRRFPLPDPLFTLYYPTAPFLWLWRRLRPQPARDAFSQSPSND